MYRSAFSKPKRATACVMGIMMLVFVLFSVLFITREAGHDCTGEDCPVCAVMMECENTLHQIGSAALPSIVPALSVFFLFFSACLFALVDAFGTPVSKKIRLNN